MNFIKLSVFVCVIFGCKNVDGKPVEVVHANESKDILKGSNYELSNGDPSFEICEQFNVTDETEMLGLHGHGVTVVMKMPS